MLMHDAIAPFAQKNGQKAGQKNDLATRTANNGRRWRDARNINPSTFAREP